MIYLLVTYYKEQGMFRVFYKSGKSVVIPNSRAAMLNNLLNDHILHWRATVKWCTFSPNSIDFMVCLEKR